MRFVALLGAVALGLLALWFQVEGGRSMPAAKGSSVVLPTPDLRGQTEQGVAAKPTPEPERRIPSDLAVETTSARREIALTGIVRCSMTGSLLDSRVQLAELATYTDPEDGRFALRAMVEGEALLHLEAEGYLAKRLPIEEAWVAHDLGIILLEPSARVHLLVRDAGGAPVSEAQVEVMGTGPLGRSGERQGRLLGLTGETGRLSIDIGQPELIAAREGTRCSEAVLVRPAAREVELTLGEGHAQGFGVRDSISGAPLADVALDIARLDGYPPLRIQARTGADGWVSRPLPPGRYRIEEPNNRVLFAATRSAFQNPSSPRNPSKLVYAVIDLPASEEPLWLDAEMRGDRFIVAEDGDTGVLLAPLHAWLGSYEVPPFVEEPQWIRLGNEIYVAEDGRISLYSFNAAFGSGSALRLYLSSPGYTTTFIDDVRAAVLPAEQPHRVEMSPAPRRSLRLITGAERPYPHRVWVREGAHKVVSYQGQADEDGFLGPLGWNGEALAIHSGPRPHSPVLATVDAVTLERTKEVEVILAEHGAIEVSVPEDMTPRIYVLGNGRSRYRGILRDGILRFDALPVGGYEIGPKELIDTISLREARGHEVLQLRVEAGDTISLPWDPAWTPPGHITGRVLAPGMEGVDLWVVPRFDSADIPLGHTGRAARFPVGKDGRYELWGLSMWPTRIMVARQELSGDLVPLGVGIPGEDLVLHCTRVLLVVKGAPPGESACVRCTPVVAGVPILGQVTKCEALDQPIDIGWIPSETRSLHLSWRGMRQVDLELTAGETVTVEVDVSSDLQPGR